MAGVVVPQRPGSQRPWAFSSRFSPACETADEAGHVVLFREGQFVYPWGSMYITREMAVRCFPPISAFLAEDTRSLPDPRRDVHLDRLAPRLKTDGTEAG